MEYFKNSWKEMEEFFGRVETPDDFCRQALAFVKEGRKLGYDQFFRIDISMRTLIISKQKEDLEQEEQYIGLSLYGEQATVECHKLPFSGFTPDRMAFSKRLIVLLEHFKDMDG